MLGHWDATFSFPLFFFFFVGSYVVLIGKVELQKEQGLIILCAQQENKGIKMMEPVDHLALAF